MLYLKARTSQHPPPVERGGQFIHLFIYSKSCLSPSHRCPILISLLLQSSISHNHPEEEIKTRVTCIRVHGPLRRPRPSALLSLVLVLCV